MDDGIARTNRSWNAAQRGERAPDGDPEDIAVIERLHRLAAATTARPGFTMRLRTELVATSPAGRSPVRLRASDRRMRPRAALGAVSTAALVMVVALLGFIAFDRAGNRNNGSGSGKGVSVILAPSTPLPGACLLRETAGVAGSASAMMVLQGETGFSKDALQGDHVQLQRWSVDPEKRATFQQWSPNDPYQGLAVDYVLSGRYTARLFAPAVIHRVDLQSGQVTEQAGAGETVELNAGDAIAFELGNGISVLNASESTTLTFARALFTAGPAGAVLPTGTGFAGSVAQASALPKTLAGIFGRDAGVIELVLTTLPGQAADATARGLCNEPERLRALTAPGAGTAPGGEAPGYALWVYPGRG